MATLVCKKAFKLNTAEGLIKFNVGDKVEGKHAEHWYAKAHCANDKKEAEKEASRDPIADALKSKELAKSLVVDGKAPTVADLNKALKEADLPPVKSAEERDNLIGD
jgi:hypothetical protein